MRRVSVLLFALVAAMIVLCAPKAANASCIGVNCSCSVSAGTLDFGAYNPWDANDVKLTTDIAVTCSALVAGLNVSYDIKLDKGVHGTLTDRKMSRGAETLSYNLFKDQDRTIIWGDGVSGGTQLVSDAYLLALLSHTRHYTVYGKLPKAQNVGVGNYSDTITVTVVF